MTIREIELNNFRIYKGKNKIELFPDGNRNLIIVSGNNGFGKTTFLMSLVWCLYGKNMGKVDELTVKDIEEIDHADVWNTPDKMYPNRPSFYCLEIRRC